MKAFRPSLLVLSVCITLAAAAAKIDVTEYAGEALDAEHGLVVLRLDWEREMKGGAAKITTRDDQKVYIVLREATGKTKDRYVVPTPAVTKAFVLPAGRWYVNEIYTPGDRGLPQITKPSKAVLQSFEVQGDKINFAGWFTVKLARDAAGEPSFDVGIDYGPEGVRQATEAFPEVFANKELLYCAIGKKCRVPAEFKL